MCIRIYPSLPIIQYAVRPLKRSSGGKFASRGFGAEARGLITGMEMDVLRLTRYTVELQGAILPDYLCRSSKGNIHSHY